MPLIPLLFGLVTQLAPALVSMFAGSKSSSITDQVLQVVQAVTGTSDQAAAVAAMKANPELQVQLQIQLATIALESAKVEAWERAGQVALNALEINKAGLFPGGWRPFFGWVVGVAVAYTVFSPTLQAVVQVWRPDFTIPPANLTDYWPAFMGMMGLSYNRTQEKNAGTATTSISLRGR